MAKYYLLAIAVVGLALYYAYNTDPCNRLVRTDFASRHPDYQIIDSDPEQGSPESVRCRIVYRKPDSDQPQEAVWLYKHEKKGWRLYRASEPQPKVEKP
jgi:hypothetical protein